MLVDNYIERKLPNGMVPYAHQLEAAQTAIHQRKSLNAFEVGLGKTLTAILVGRVYKRTTDNDIVVVAPASLQENWRRELDGLLEAHICSAGKIPLPGDFSGPFFLIVDEAHYYQNILSKRTKAILALSDASQGNMLLTATPIRNYPSNLFPLLKAIDHPVGQNYNRYLVRYCNAKVAGSSNLMSLHSQIQTSITTGSKEDYLDLPSFTRIMQKVKFWGIAQIIFNKAIGEMRKEYKLRVESGQISNRGFHIVILNHLRHAASMGKAVQAVKIAEKALENDHNVVIFTGFNSSARYINRWLGEHGTRLLNGAVPKHKRQKLVDDFQEDLADVFIMTKAGSAGLNLQRGTVFISVDRTWSPYDMIQAEGRIHRNGQHNKCWSIWIQDEVIDPYLDHMMLRKYRVAREVLYGTVDTMEGLGDPGDWARDLNNFIFDYKGERNGN